MGVSAADHSDSTVRTESELMGGGRVASEPVEGEEEEVVFKEGESKGFLEAEVELSWGVSPPSWFSSDQASEPTVRTESDVTGRGRGGVDFGEAVTGWRKELGVSKEVAGFKGRN